MEYRENPEGVDVLKSRFFWKWKSDESGQIQKAYQLIVATSKENLDNNIGDAYNSKKVNSNQSTQIEHSRHRCFSNFISNIVAGLIANSFLPKKKTAIKYQTVYTNQLAIF